MKKIWTKTWITLATVGIIVVTAGLILAVHCAKAGLWTWNALRARRSSKGLA